jgi:hypothetical protein
LQVADGLAACLDDVGVDLRPRQPSEQLLARIDLPAPVARNLRMRMPADEEVDIALGCGADNTDIALKRSAWDAGST